MKMYKWDVIKLIKSMPVDMFFEVKEEKSVQCGENRYSVTFKSDYWSESIDSQDLQK